MNLIEFKNITKIYDKRSVYGVSNINLKIKEKDFITILGPSGAGKTTLLKLITEDLQADSGEFTKNTNLKIAVLDQNQSLEPEKTLFENLLSKMTLSIDEEKRQNQVRMILSQFDLTNEINKKASELSHGQNQRALISSVLVNNPNLVLLDEPFSNLDLPLRTEIMHELFAIFKDKGIACLWVTHDLNDALAYSRRIIMLNFGKITQVGSPKDIFYRPNSLFSANYFGETNLFTTKCIGRNPVMVHVLGKDYELKDFQYREFHGEDILISIKPEFLYYDPDSHLKGKVISSKFMGNYQLVEILYKGETLWMKVDGFKNLSTVKSINFNLKPQGIFCVGDI
jgi:ABC-type Fe3+/spermidine/putrescine transport system ATPase subunit